MLFHNMYYMPWNYTFLPSLAMVHSDVCLIFLPENMQNEKGFSEPH